ncbi:MAG: SURF1 family protein [Gammaproteobacteria bacterium]|nr:SURF1 family protein [Gammaproteobacteria bacterium]
MPARRFQPPLWASLGTLVLGGAFVGLGNWQLDRSEQKDVLFERFDTGSAGAPAPAPTDGAALATQRYAVIMASGGYDVAHQVLLDARTRDGRAGYEVLTPLVGDGTALLVNRGWIPANPDRRKLPDLAVGDAPRQVTGLLDALPRAALRAGPSDTRPDLPWPRVMLYPTAADLAQALGYPVRDYQLLLDPVGADGFDRRWRPALLTPVEHIGYAVQWFALAGLVVVLYVVLNWRRVSHSAYHHE